MSSKAVLLMAYGTPDRLEDVEAYFTHIRGGRTPSPDAIANLVARYERVGGGTPLRRISEEVRDALEASLRAAAEPYRVYLGMKHWHPYIADTMVRMRDDGITDVTCIALAPHCSRMSVGAYCEAADQANRALGSPFALHLVTSWYDEPRFIEMMANSVRSALLRFPQAERDDVAVVFTAHSLPERIRTWGDAYEAELAESSAQVAREARIGPWRFAWQSAGGTHEPWIGPDVLEELEVIRQERVRNVLLVPIGFVCDHLEVLYDIDIEAKEKARSLGMRLERTALPNASPAFIRVLTDVVRGRSITGRGERLNHGTPDRRPA
ncbi:MAG TPA: ferrochelatase [Gemmatimonadaceae bacterium]|nr:ferrochelatase [Gemmatimonadaceae bacterium]